MNELKVKKRSSMMKPIDIRSKDMVPGVLYGSGMETQAVKLKKSELEKYLAQDGEVYKVETKDGTKFVKFEEIQKDALQSNILHFSLVSLKKNEKTTLDIPISFVGEPIGFKSGGNLLELQDALSVTAKPRELPDTIELNVSDLNIGDKVTVSDVSIDGEVEISEKEDKVLAICTTPIVPNEATREENEPMLVGDEEKVESEVNMNRLSRAI